MNKHQIDQIGNAVKKELGARGFNGFNSRDSGKSGVRWRWYFNQRGTEYSDLWMPDTVLNNQRIEDTINYIIYKLGSEK